jgi:hypothetical protein
MRMGMNKTRSRKLTRVPECKSGYEYGLKQRYRNRKRNYTVLEIRFSDPSRDVTPLSGEHPGCNGELVKKANWA